MQNTIRERRFERDDQLLLLLWEEAMVDMYRFMQHHKRWWTLGTKTRIFPTLQRSHCIFESRPGQWCEISEKGYSQSFSASSFVAREMDNQVWWVVERDRWRGEVMVAASKKRPFDAENRGIHA